jgi:hypothetical protein
MVQHSLSNSNMYLPVTFSWNNSNCEAQVFNMKDELPSQVKQFCINTNQFSLQPDYLTIKHQDKQAVYLFVVTRGLDIVGIASVYQAKVDLKLKGKELTKNKFAQILYDYIVHPLFKNRQILCLGSLFISGDAGNSGTEHTEEHDWHQMLIEGFGEWNLANQQYHKSIGWLGLDLCDENGCLTNGHTHIPLRFEPIMELNVASWSDFDDYKNSLKAKFRTKLNKALEVGKDIVVKKLSPTEVKENQERLNSLFTQVKSRSAYYGGDYNIADLVGINQKFSNTYTTGFYLENTLIGFATTIINNNTYIAHMIGMDYTKSKPISLYENILYHYIADAIKNRATKLNLGRTALVIKSGVGAIPQFYYCCLKFNKCWWHHIGQYIAPKLAIEIPSFRNALKKHEIEQHTV